MPLAANERLVIEPNRSGGKGWDQAQFTAEVIAAGGGGGNFVTLDTAQTITGQKTFTAPILSDDLQEAVPFNGITLTADDPGGAGTGTCVFDGNKLTITSPRNGFGDALEVGWDTTGDPTTPEAFVLGRSNVAGFMFIMPGANFPQFICGDDQNTGAVFWDGNGNKDFRFNTLDTGPNRDNVCYFGYGGINLQDQGGDAIFLRSPAAVAGTFTLTLPPTDGAIGQVLVNQDGAGTLDWGDQVGAFTQQGSNLFGGTNALGSLTTGNNNFAAMDNALSNITTQSFNIGIGPSAGLQCTSTTLTTAIGYLSVSGSAAAALTGNQNTGVGDRALTFLTGTAQFNSALGALAGSRITTGEFNTMIGARTGSETVAITGDLSTLVGYQAGRNMQGAAENNTLIGSNAGDAVTNGINMICLGRAAGPVANRSNQLFIDITQRDDPLIFGDFAGRSVQFNGLTRVNDANALRLQELEINGFNYVELKAPDDVTVDRTWTLMSDAPVDGYLVQTDSTGALSLVDPNTIGNSVFAEDAQTNIIGGTGAAQNWSTFANSNFVGGVQAYEIAGSPDFCVAVGYRAGRYCSGSQNIQIGAESGRGISAANPLTGLDNVYIGHFSGRASAGNSNRNTCVGAESGNRNLAGADNNTFIGCESGGTGGLTAADNSTLGYQSGFTLAGGCARNTLIGKGAGRVFSNVAPDTDNVCLGNEAGPTAAGVSNRLFIDNTQRNDPLIEGDFSARSININGQLESDGGTVNPSFRVDNNATAGETRMLLWDVDNGTLERVSVGAADSGGTGFKVLRIPN